MAHDVQKRCCGQSQPSLPPAADTTWKKPINQPAQLNKVTVMCSVIVPASNHCLPALQLQASGICTIVQTVLQKQRHQMTTTDLTPLYAVRFVQGT
jgi:hypothetical protein